MSEKKNPFSKFKLVYRRSSPMVKILACVAIVFSMLAITALAWIRSGVEDKTFLLRKEAARLEQANAALEAKIAVLGSVQGVRQIAEEELGLVDSGTVFFEVK